MHPILSSRRRFLSYSLIAALIGAGFAELLHQLINCQRAEALLFALPLCLLYGWVLCSAYYVSRAFPLQNRRLIRTLTVFISSALIAAATIGAAVVGWHFLLTEMAMQTHGDPLGVQFLLNSCIAAFLLYLIALLAYDIVLAFEDIRKAELHRSQATLLARDAELQVLRSQIDPHFLFNSLNSISALTAIDPAAARDMTIALADFFRLTLALADRREIRLQDEWHLCQRFLSVEQIRFGDKLQLDCQFDDASLAASVPPMILQPLLENAIKHGIRHLRQGGMISVRGETRNGWLYISVANPCTESDKQNIGNQLGLANLKQRFASLYQDRAQVSWQKSDTEFSVNITLPIKAAEHDTASI